MTCRKKFNAESTREGVTLTQQPQAEVWQTLVERDGYTAATAG